MQRIYATRLLPAPKMVTCQGKKYKIGAVQVPIEFQQLTRNNHLISYVAAQQVELQENPETLRVTYHSGKALKHAALHLKAVEEQGEGKIFTLIYDQENILPLCNFRNRALAQTPVEALEIQPGVREELAVEVRAALITTGLGHYSRLVSIHNQDGFKFIVDKLAALQPFLSFIKDRDLNAFVRKAIILSFAQFYLGPSSTGAKYHPLDEIRISGLLHHTERVAFLALKLAQKLKLSKKAQEEVVASALLHDICKGVSKNEDGSFAWGFHSTADHSVFGAEWLEKILSDYFPSKQEAVQAARKRVIQSVRYHSNIWVDNYDTALTATNPIADWLVSLADVAVSHKHVRVHYPAYIGTYYPKVSPEKHAAAVDGILAHPLDYEWEGLADNWAELPAQTKRALFVAAMCFRQYEIVEENDKQEVIQAVIRGEIPSASPAELVRDKKKLTVWAALTIPRTTGMDIYLREEINQELSKAQRKESHWITSEPPPEAVSAITANLMGYFKNHFQAEFWLQQKQRLLDLLNSRLKKDLVEEQAINDDLLAAFMLKYGTLDIDEIYYQICGQWSKKAEVRSILKASPGRPPEEILREIEETGERGGYSSTATGHTEGALRERLNLSIGKEADQLKPFLPEVMTMLDRDLPPAEAALVKKHIAGADRLKYSRHTPKRIFARIKATTKTELPDHVKKALNGELDYIQRYPLNRINDEIVAWLMERYGANTEAIFAALEQAGLDRVVPILQKYEAETRKIEAEYVANQKKTRTTAAEQKERDALFAREKAELEALLPPGPARAAVSVGKIPELEAVARFMLNYELNMENLQEFLAFARDPENFKHFDYVPGIQQATKLIFESLERLEPGQKIGVYGDYDADGICGTVILVRALEELAADKAEFVGRHIPDRSRGFGPNRESLREMIDGGYTTIITTDNGAGGAAEIAWAKEYAAAKGIKLTFIVTDHHPFGDHPPEVDAFVHPKLLDPGHPAYYIPGAQVAWKVAAALFAQKGLDIGQKYLEYAAIATITDVVPMKKKSENRATAKFGFDKFNRIYAFLASLEEKYKNTEGDADRIEAEKLYNEPEFRGSGLDIGLYLLAKMIKVSSFDRDKIGFGLGPVLNAVGRLAEAGLAVDLLLAKTPDEALKIIEKLITYNVRRKEMQALIEEEAFAQLEQQIQTQEHVPGKDHAVVLHGENWHRGIVGLVASTLAEHIQGIAAIGTGRHGSMRTIPGLHILKTMRRAVALYKVDTDQDSFFEKQGGHAGAAGYTLKPDKAAVFQEYLKRAANEIMGEDESFRALYGIDQPKKLVKVEAYLDAEKISWSFYTLNMLFAPFAQQSYGIFKDEVPRPVYASQRLKVADFGMLGGGMNHLQIEFEDRTGRKIKGAYFRENNLATKALLHAKETGEEVFVDLAYVIDLDYKGNPQLLIVDIVPSA